MTLKTLCRAIGREQVRACWEAVRFILTTVAGAGFLALLLWFALWVLEYSKRHGL